MTTQLEGLDLVRAVIEKVRTHGFKDVFGSGRIVGNPEPRPVAVDVLEHVRLDGDLPLTPCMKEWLAFDGTLFGWINRDGTAQGERLGELALDRLEDAGRAFGALHRRLPRLCYALPFGDKEYLHFVYPSKHDSIGELPVLSAEAGDQRVLVSYPGIDAFLGQHAGLLEKRWQKRFKGRFAEHQVQTLGGNGEIQIGLAEDEAPAEELPLGVERLDATTYGMIGDGPVPPGFWVIHEAENPFTHQRMRMLMKAC